MQPQAETMVLASFAADALALPAHWIYDTAQIDSRFGRIDAFLDPTPPTYHGTKRAGDFTHYGDQALVLLESLAACGGFDMRHFAGAWRAFFDGYEGYFDGATKATLANLAAGADVDHAGSDSHDLAGAARIAPLVYCYRRQPERLAAAARRQTAFTHDHPEVVAAAEFFAQLALAALAGTAPRRAIGALAEDLPAESPLAEWVKAGLASAGDDTREAIGRFGRMCAVEAAFPATIHLIAKYEQSLAEGLVANVMAGGDSAGRGLLAGMVLGAYQGPDALPEAWRRGLNAGGRITALLAALDGKVENR